VCVCVVFVKTSRGTIFFLTEAGGELDDVGAELGDG